MHALVPPVSRRAMMPFGIDLPATEFCVCAWMGL